MQVGPWADALCTDVEFPWLINANQRPRGGCGFEQIHAHLYLHLSPESLGGDTLLKALRLDCLRGENREARTGGGGPAFHQLLLLYYLNFCHEYASILEKKKIELVKERRREEKTRQLLGTGTQTPGIWSECGRVGGMLPEHHEVGVGVGGALYPIPSGSGQPCRQKPAGPRMDGQEQ